MMQQSAASLSQLSPRSLTLMLWVSVAGMCFFLLGSTTDSIRGTMNIAENWGSVERVALWQNWLSPIIPRYTLWHGVVAWGFRLCMVLGFACQVGIFTSLLRGGGRPTVWTWLSGPLVAHVIMTVFMVPSNSDLFFYEAVGDFAANGINPYTHVLMDQPNNPLIPYNYWIDIGTVYGPNWVNYNRLIMAITGPDPIVASLVQKALCGIVALLVALLVYWFSQRLTGGYVAVSAACAAFVAWQPNMLLESSGQVHNDLHVILVATAALALLIVGGMRSIRGSAVLVALAVSIKFVAVPLLGVVEIVRLADRRQTKALQRILGGWILDGIGVIAVTVGSFAPYWDGLNTFHEMLDEPNRLYAHPFWRAIQSLMYRIAPRGVADAYTQVTRTSFQLISIAIFLGVVIWMGRRIWQSSRVPAGDAPQPLNDIGLPWWTELALKGWMVMILVSAYVPVNVHSWYWTWPVAAVAVYLAFRFRHMESWTACTVPTWVWVYVWGNALLTLAYHTRIARY